MRARYRESPQQRRPAAIALQALADAHTQVVRNAAIIATLLTAAAVLGQL